MPDDWQVDPNHAISELVMRRVRDSIESSPVIVEHRFYRGARDPERLVFDDFEEFREYIENAKPGDRVFVWSYGAVCLDSNCLVSAKYPDAQGRVPIGGAY